MDDSPQSSRAERRTVKDHPHASRADRRRTVKVEDFVEEREKDEESEEFDRSGVAEFPFDDADAALVD